MAERVKERVWSMSETDSLLRQLACTRPHTAPPRLDYDSARQVSRVLENGRWVDSWKSETLTGTKKADEEKGEDAKGR
jgi:hypothetical protein